MVQLTSIQISDGTSGTTAGAMKALPNSKPFSLCCSLTLLLPARAAGARKQPLKEAGAGVRVRCKVLQKNVWKEEKCIPGR